MPKPPSVPQPPVPQPPALQPTDPGPSARQVPGRRGPLAVNLPAASAGTRPVPADAPDLRLPHERDQSAVDSTAATPDPVVAQAAKDLAAGQVDTDLRNPGGLDDRRRRQLIAKEK